MPNIQRRTGLIIYLWLVISFIGFTTNAASQEQQDPFVTVQTVATNLFAKMKQQQSEIQQNPELLRQIVETELFPHVDYEYSALVVLSSNAKNIEKEKLREFIGAFRDYLVTTYANSLGYYKQQTVSFEPSKDVDGKKLVAIKVLVKDTGKPDLEVIFKVRLNKSGQWLAYDMVAEGVSLLQSKRTEFASVIRQQGVDSTIELMKEKAAQPIKLPKST